jgi:phenylacetate-coenzyme A ligase PaaK-like adenylate-forming protein
MKLEDRLHKDTASYLTYLQINFTYVPSGEQRTLITGALLKAKGLKKGLPDFVVRYKVKDIAYFLYLEAKCGKNKQSPEQKCFEKLVEGSKYEKYYVYKSIEELKEILTIEGLIR